jgi:hypothetical protein
MYNFDAIGVSKGGLAGNRIQFGSNMRTDLAQQEYGLGLRPYRPVKKLTDFVNENQDSETINLLRRSANRCSTENLQIYIISHYFLKR